ncbi:MAG TPA: glycosyltransferase family 2 protein [Phycisphaerales bacterium]|nr:glycosyltransferase family 2 protein [Phycisphaerales bacterium]
MTADDSWPHHRDRTRRLAVVILNYKTPKLVRDCLATLQGQLDPARDVAIVVDNDSGDGSDDVIESEIAEQGWSDWVRLVRSGVNGGFSAGNNVGIKAERADFYLLLNSDTLVRTGTIEEMLRAAEQNQSAGLIGPRLEWPDGEPQNSCFRDMGVFSELIAGAQSGPITKLFAKHDVTMGVFEDPTRVEWVSFACVLIRRSVIDRIGLMDEGFFMYFEDAEYCRRARRAGFEVLYWPEAHVVHLRGGSSPVKSAAAARKRLPAYFYASRSRYFSGAGGRLNLVLVNIAWTLGWLVALGRRVVQGRRIGTPERALRDNWTAFWSSHKPKRSRRSTVGRGVQA